MKGKTAMRAPFFRYILGGYLAITVAFIFIGSVVGVLAFQHYARQVQIRELERVAATLVTVVEPIYKKQSTGELQRMMLRQAEKLKLRITVINDNGRVLADSERDPQTVLNHIGRPEIQAALNGRTGSAVRLSDSVGRSLIYVAVPLLKGTQVAGVLRISVGLYDMRLYTQPFIAFLLFCGFVFLLLVSVYAVFLARSIARPLDELSAAAQAMSVGTLSTRVHLRSPLFRGIGEMFNTMAERLERTIVETKKQKQELAVLIEALPAGILAIDAQNRISLANTAVRQVFNAQPVTGEYVWEFCRDIVVNDLIAAAQRGRVQTRDVHRDNKIFQVTSCPISTGVLLLFQEVTELRLLAEVKRDFVVNASHELRTPLTAIKGFSENLLDETTGDAKHYAEIIHKNTERLINIVQDIMLLSELESGKDALNQESLQLRRLLDDVLMLFTEKAKAKNITLELTGDTDLAVRGDQFKLQQVFINLIDNALKYTDAGKVSVVLSQEEQHVRVSVRDSGIGIAPEHLARLFERFYVVDKSRSRKTGGTGLGLSIVKHIVLLHNGTIDVSSVPGQGTTFTVTLPL